MISNSARTTRSLSMNGPSNREKVLCRTHLAVVPKLSSFSEEEDVEEALKKAASVWLGLLARPGLMGEDLSYSGVCLPSRGMLLKLFGSTESTGKLLSTRFSGYECWTWRRCRKHKHVVVQKAETPALFHCSIHCTPVLPQVLKAVELVECQAGLEMALQQALPCILV